MPERDELRDLPGLARFGEELVAAARREPRRRRAWGRRPTTLALCALIGVAATATATAAALRYAVIPTPDPKVLPSAQTPADGSTVLAAPRAADPAGGPPWALRLTRSQAGLTCTTVGQLRDGVFGLVGEDRVFRALPTAISDACSGGTLIGARIVAAAKPGDVRTIVYGVAGAVRQATLVTTSGRRPLTLGARGTFVAALRGYPEDSAATVELTGADGRRTTHSLGARSGIVADVDGAAAWQLERYVLGTRLYCAHLRDARAPATADVGAGPEGGRASAPTTCVDRRARAAWAASAVRLIPGARGRPGFDRWEYRRPAARTLVLGVARRAGLVSSVTVLGAGPARRVAVAPNGTFALLLPPAVDPAALRLRVALAGGRSESGRPGHGVVPDLVASRRTP